MRHPAAALVLMLLLPTNPVLGARIELAAAVQAETTQTVELAGVLAPARQAQLYAHTSGYLEEVLVHLGDRVEKGQVLARVRVPDASGLRDSARARLEDSKARLETAINEARVATRNHERMVELDARQPGNVTPTDMETADMRARSADTNVQIARAAVLGAQAECDRIEQLNALNDLRAPFSGVIAVPPLEPGNAIANAAGGGKPVVEVMQTQTLRLVLDAPGPATLRMYPGCPASITTPFLGDRPFPGHVAHLGASIQTDSGTAKVEVEVDNPDGALAPGQVATARISYSVQAHLVPLEAIRQECGSSVVYVAERALAHRVVVDVLSRKPEGAMVLGDLDGEVQVIVSAPISLKAGDPVVIAP